MADIPLYVPTQIRPINPTTDPRRNSGLTVYQFGIALLTLYLIMRYVPRGVEIGAIILAVTLISTPAAVQGFSDLLHTIETGVFPS